MTTQPEISKPRKIAWGRKAGAELFAGGNVRRFDGLLEAGYIVARKFGRRVAIDVEATERKMFGGDVG